VELADLVESDAAEAEHRVARRVGPGQRHPRFCSAASSSSMDLWLSHGTMSPSSLGPSSLGER
jgi:hypothetical protein